MSYLDNGSSDTTVICNLFADYLKSVYTNSKPSPPLSDFSNLNTIFNISTVCLSIADVESALLADCLPLLLIFNKSNVFR